MKKNIAVLGPPGTFTEIATRQYLKKQGLDMELQYYPTLKKAFHAIGSTCELGVIPIENTLDGFVTVVLDLMTHSDLKIIHETVLPIQFAFVANCESIEQVTRVFAQFKSHQQCLDFLERLGDTPVVTTESNSESYNEVGQGTEGWGAIIPRHMLKEKHAFKLVIDNVADSLENQTRFVILSKEMDTDRTSGTGWKTMFVMSDESDRPGLLVDILNIFKEAGINLVSIYSRPKKTGLGNYNFFIDIQGCYVRDAIVRSAVEKIQEKFNIKILGSYYRV